MTEKEYKEWKDKLSVSGAKHKAEVEDKLKLNRNYYRGSQWTKESSLGYSEQIVDNIIFSNIRTIMPAVNFRNPKVFVTAKKKPYLLPDGSLFDTVAGSVIFELILNHCFEDLHVKEQVDKALLDALIGPWGIIQIGYDVKVSKVKVGKDEKELLDKETPFVKRISPADFRVDPGATSSDLSDAHWVAFKWVCCLTEVKNNPKYKNTWELKSNFVVKTDYGVINESKTSDTTEESLWSRVEGWDIWDRDEQKIITIVESHDKELRHEDWMLDYNDSFPVEILYFNENPDELIPIGDIDIYRSGQDELNRLRSLQIDHVKRISQRKYLGKTGILSVENKTLLMQGGDGAFVEMDEGDPLTDIVPLKDATISQDIYMVSRGLKEDIREAAGLSGMDKGLSTKFDTAAEPQMIQQGVGVRREDKAAIVERFITKVVKKLAAVLQQTLTERDIPLTEDTMELASQYIPNKLAKIAGQAGEIILPWLTANKDDVAGEYDFKIELGSTRPEDKETKKRDTVMLANMLKGNPNINEREGIKRLLEVFNVLDVEKMLKPAEQVQQEGIARKKEAMAMEEGKGAAKRQADLMKTQMKTKTSVLTTALKIIGDKNKATEVVKNASI